jgi:hypothetical protein
MAEYASVEDFWEGFNQGEDPDEVNCSFNEGIAKNVLDTFGIPNNVSIEGGNLDGIDIKSMDAFTALKTSLLHQSSKDEKIYEPITNADGQVEFVAIGETDGLGDTEVYYEIQTGTFQEECSGVMITGRRPMAKRKKAEWKPIWKDETREVFNAYWMAPNCLEKKYASYATIVFTDPHLNDTEWEDGIDNFYEIKTPWENLLGYARWVNWPGADSSPDTDIKRSNQSRIPVVVTGGKDNEYNAKLGNLQARPPMPDAVNDQNIGCFAEATTDVKYSDGVPVTLPEKFRYEDIRGTKVDHFVGISAVYLIGRKIDDAKSIPSTAANAVKDPPSDSDCKLKVTINESQNEVFKLEEGFHYQIAYKEGRYGPDPAIVFASNSRFYDPKEFGTNKTMYIDEECVFFRNGAGGNPVYVGSILPTGGTEAYLVSQIFCIADMDIPSITVYDPRVEQGGGEGMAKYIADHLEYNLAALVSEEPPAPVAFAGSAFTGLIDLVEMEKDHDPTTHDQNFQDTDYQRAIEAMDHGGGLSLSFSFLEADEVETLAKTLYTYMNSGDGAVTTLICSPDSKPVLGGYGKDNSSIVNEIVYSYQDSNSYTISVSCGPKLLGDFAQIDGGPSYKMVEEVSARGTIKGDAGDCALFNVLVDGYGPVTAINCTSDILRVGDKVQVTVHNNPVEA